MSAGELVLAGIEIGASCVLFHFSKTQTVNVDWQFISATVLAAFAGMHIANAFL